MDERERESLRQYVSHWRRVGPLLEEVRTRELRVLDPNVGEPLIEDLLDLAEVAAPPPVTTSGLVEMQRKFQKFWK